VNTQPISDTPTVPGQKIESQNQKSRNQVKGLSSQDVEEMQKVETPKTIKNRFTKFMS